MTLVELDPKIGDEVVYTNRESEDQYVWRIVGVAPERDGRYLAHFVFCRKSPNFEPNSDPALLSSEDCWEYADPFEQWVRRQQEALNGDSAASRG